MSAKKYFEEKFDSLSQEKLKFLFKKVTEQLLFNEYIIENLDEVFITFETMNNRGKQLSALELLKNRLIYLSTIFIQKHPQDEQVIENVKTLRTNINNTWKTIYEYLGKSTKKKLSDDLFLRDHWIMFFRYDRTKSQVFKKDLLSEYFTAKKVLNNSLKIEQINEYVLNLQKSIVQWFNICCPDESTLDKELKEWLTRLNRVGIGSFRPLLMSAYLKKSDADVLNIVKASERFRFLVSCISERRSNTSDSYFYTLAHTYFMSNNEINLTNNIDQQTDYWLNIDNFINNSVDRYNKNCGFYSWKGLRYFLYEYEKHLQSDNEIKVEWEIFEKNQSNKVSVEHVYPQTPTDEYWTSRFNTNDKKALTHSLGNLLLLTNSKNSALQNDPFQTKKKTIRDEQGNITYYGYDTGSYSELAVASKVEWNSDEIISRGKEMLSFLTSHWKIGHNFNNEEIIKLLNISGVLPKESTVDVQDYLLDDSSENLDEI